MDCIVQEIGPITAKLIGEESRMGFLPAFFGPGMFSSGEPLVFTWMGRLSKDYSGGSWDYYKLTNGGFYMAPSGEKSFRVEIDANYFDGVFTADAAGIVATLFALCELANRSGEDRIINLYHRLREYASQHAEAAQIWVAID